MPVDAVITTEEEEGIRKITAVARSELSKFTSADKMETTPRPPPR